MYFLNPNPTNHHDICKIKLDCKKTSFQSLKKKIMILIFFKIMTIQGIVAANKIIQNAFFNMD